MLRKPKCINIIFLFNIFSFIWNGSIKFKINIKLFSTEKFDSSVLNYFVQVFMYICISISGVGSLLICTFTRINVHKSIRRCDYRHIQCIRFHILILYMFYFNYMYLCIYTKEVKHFYWFFLIRRGQI